jgi:uncharacterized protein (TIGR02145 family)
MAYAINQYEAISYVKERACLTDVEKNIYPIVKIGDQWWMAENLNNSSIESSCFLDKSEYCETYGRLYSWNAALNSCPTGWHLPSDSEWTVLVDFLGGAEVAGAKLIEIDSELWRVDITGSSNESGFSALPGGYGAISNYGNLMFTGVGFYAFFWSSTEHDSEDSWFRVIHGVKEIWREDFSNTSRYSEQCVMDPYD